MSVLLGNGDGTFQTHVDYGTGNYSSSVVVGDFNGDGKADLVATNYYSTVSVLLGNGDGTFQTHVDYGTAGNPVSVAVGNFNGDGKLDLATTNGNGNTVSVLLGNGDGTFQTQVDYGTGSSPFSVAVGDFNGDGKADLVTANYGDNTMSVLLNTGAGICPPLVALSPASLSFAPQPLNTTSPLLNVTVTNTGGGTLNFSGFSFTGANANDFSLTNLCGSTLGAGASCTVEVGFKPIVRGARTASLSIADNAAGSPQTVALSGTGDALSLSAYALNFGNVAVGSSSTQTVTVTNVSSRSFGVGVINLTGKNQHDYSQTNTCGASLAAKASCTITVTFTPAFKNSTRTASLNMPNGGTGTFATQAVALTGVGK